jgi:hypothetical protein
MGLVSETIPVVAHLRVICNLSLRTSFSNGRKSQVRSRSMYLYVFPLLLKTYPFRKKRHRRGGENLILLSQELLWQWTEVRASNETKSGRGIPLFRERHAIPTPRRCSLTTKSMLFAKL